MDVRELPPIDSTTPQALAFNTEAVRGYLFTAAVEIARGLKEGEVEHGEAALITGAVEMAAQLFAQVMHQAGKTPRESRMALEKIMRQFHRKHWGAGQEAKAS